MQPLVALRAARFASTERSPFILPAITVYLSVVVYFLTRHKVGVVAFLRGARDESWTVVAGCAIFSAVLLFSLAHLIETLSDLLLERTFADRLGGFPHERVVPSASTTPRFKQFNRRRIPKLFRRFSIYEGSRIIIFCGVIVEPVVIWFRSEALQDSVHLKIFVEGVIGYLCVAALTAIPLLLPGLAAGFGPVSGSNVRPRFVSRWFHRLGDLFHRVWVARIFVRVWKSLIWWPALIAYEFCDRVLRYVLRLNGEIDRATYKRFKIYFQERLGMDFERISNNDRFWLTYFVLLADAPALMKPIGAARNLANFCRNQCLALFLAAIGLTLSYRLDQPDVCGFVTRNDVRNLAFICAVGSWVFYWKFLQGYYSCTKMAFRAFATIRDTSEKPSEMGTEVVKGN